jgi:release factor glutamine methyltransferase
LQDKSRKRWSPLELINWTAGYLGDRGFENGRLTAERFLARVLNTDRVQLYLDFDKPLSAAELSEFKTLLKRRLAREPLQYILGETEFFSLPVKVAPGALIPRPETEIIVEQVLELATELGSEGEEVDILDVGTGSGIIAVAVAVNCPAARIVAVDISAGALNVARENIALHGLDDRVRLVRQDALGSWPEIYRGAFDILIANPPYVGERDYGELPAEIRDYEPEIALLAGVDGLSFYRNFAGSVPELLKPGGYAFFELGKDMADRAIQIFTERGLSDFFVYPDLAGFDRVLKMRRSDL